MRSALTSGLACAVALCLSWLAHAERRDAEPLVVALEYSAAPDCPGVSDFRDIVFGRLGYDAFRDGMPDRVLVQIAAHGPAFEGRIEWRDADGKWAGDRTFPSRSTDCRELARAMAFALALQIQLSATVGAPAGATGEVAAETGRGSPPPVTAPAPPAISPAPDAAAAPGSAPTLTQAPAPPLRGPRPALAVGAGAFVGFGVSSSAVPFGRAFASLAWPHWSLELAAEVGLPSTVRRGDGAGFSQQEVLAGAAGCGTVTSWSACVVVKAGEIRVDGKDIDAPTSRSGPLVETGLRLAAMQPLGRRFYVAAQAEGLLVVTRWRVTLDQNLVWASPRLAGTVGFDLGLRFP